MSSTNEISWFKTTSAGIFVCLLFFLSQSPEDLKRTETPILWFGENGIYPISKIPHTWELGGVGIPLKMVFHRIDATDDVIMQRHVYCTSIAHFRFGKSTRRHFFEGNSTRACLSSRGQKQQKENRSAWCRIPESNSGSLLNRQTSSFPAISLSREVFLDGIQTNGLDFSTLSRRGLLWSLRSRLGSLQSCRGLPSTISLFLKSKFCRKALRLKISVFERRKSHSIKESAKFSSYEFPFNSSKSWKEFSLLYFPRRSLHFVKKKYIKKNKKFAKAFLIVG